MPTHPAAAPSSSARKRATYPCGSPASSRSNPAKQQGSATAPAYSAKSSRTAASCAPDVVRTSVAIYYSSMRLHQLKVDYDAEQDRLLMLVATSEGVELRLALTRR